MLGNVGAGGVSEIFGSFGVSNTTGGGTVISAMFGSAGMAGFSAISGVSGFGTGNFSATDGACGGGGVRAGISGIANGFIAISGVSGFCVGNFSATDGAGGGVSAGISGTNGFVAMSGVSGFGSGFNSASAGLCSGTVGKIGAFETSSKYDLGAGISGSGGMV